jgi:acetyl/propionyl-CoA carboxylase alpha subunit
MLQEAKGVAFGVLIGNGAEAAVETILGAVRSFFSLKNEFDSSLRNLSAITGASGDDLEFLRQSAIDLSKTGSRSAKEYVEAMKLMNEIEAEWPGRITKVLVENGQAVEFGEPLFCVDVA